MKNCHEAQLAVLMDIRAELQTLNRVLACPNFLGIPHSLKSIMANSILIAMHTKKAKRKKPAARRGKGKTR